MLHELQMRVFEANNYLKALFKNSAPPINKFIIFGNYRTGSHLLTSLLNSHPETMCDGEIFHKFVKFRVKAVASPTLYMDGLAIRMCMKDKKSTYGCNVKLHQLATVLTRFHKAPQEVMFNLYQNGWKIIRLKRLNILRQAISDITAYKRGQGHDTRDRPLIRSRVSIDCIDLILKMKWMEYHLISEDEILGTLPCMTIVYENDLLRSEKHQTTVDKIFNFLGLNSVAVQTTFARVSSDQLSDHIQNYEEVARVVSKTKYAGFLKE